MGNNFEKLTQELSYRSSGSVSANFTLQTMTVVCVDVDMGRVYSMEGMRDWL